MLEIHFQRLQRLMLTVKYRLFSIKKQTCYYFEIKKLSISYVHIIANTILSTMNHYLIVNVNCIECSHNVDFLNITF